MRPAQLLKHALTLIRREFGSGEYRLTLFALLIGVAAVTSLSLTTSRIQNAMLGQAADFIGGDLVISSSEPINADLLNTADTNQLQRSLSVSSMTMVSNGDDFVLSSIRAVDDHYPLKGKVGTRVSRDADTVEERARPSSGQAWAEKRLLERLGLSVGQTIEVGYAHFTITRLLEIEPDRGGSFYSFNPRILINWVDLEHTAIVQPGSRLRYKLMLSGTPDDVARFTKQAKAKLTANQRLTTPQSRESQVSGNLERASAFLNIGALLSVLLCGIAVSLAASRHARRHINQVALLRCFGLRANEVNLIYALQLIFIAIPAILLGLLIGYLVHASLMQLLAELFTGELPAASISAWLSGPITALCMTLGFGLPPLLRLAQTPPARVFRKEQGPNTRTPLFSTSIALVALSLIAWWQTGNFKLAAFSVAGTLGVIVALAGAIVLMLKMVARRNINQPIVRGALSNIMTRPALTAMQIVGFGISVFAIVLIIFFRNDLFDQWNAQVPVDAPNRFVFDILPNDAAAFISLLETNDIETDLYATVRGRLIKINSKIVQSAVSKEKDQSDEALNRELSLTQVAKLPYENEITAGTFVSNFSGSATDKIPVSVESKLAENLSLSLNDTLEFLIEGQTLNAYVASIRLVNWENFRPNFYMLFPSGTLDNFSHSGLGSFYLPSTNTRLDKQINQQFTGATLIDVDYVLKRIRRILDQVSSAMELTFSMAIVAGLAVFWAALLISFDEKQQQAALLRALGASRRNVSMRFITEQLMIGLLAGLLSALCLTLVSYLISTRVLELPWEMPWKYVLALPLIMMLALSALSSLQLKRILNQPPYQRLKHQE